jgi:triacylglycerol lipase
MRLAAVPLAGLALTLLTACGSITDPAGARLATQALTVHAPILFVHGWNASATTWTTMVGRFKKDGWTSAELATFSYNTAQSNKTTAAIISGKVDSILAATGATRVEIVTHSMGTLSARYYVRNLGGGGKVDALVSLGGPSHGTTTAWACLQTSCREMQPYSSFLTALNATDETWGTPRYATWRSPCDEVINPRSSPSLTGATNTQTACMKHSQLHEDSTVYAQVRDWVNRPATAALVASVR